MLGLRGHFVDLWLGCCLRGHLVDFMLGLGLRGNPIGLRFGLVFTSFSPFSVANYIQPTGFGQQAGYTLPSKKISWGGSYLDSGNTCLRRWANSAMLSRLGCPWVTRFSSLWCAPPVSCDDINLTFSLSFGLGDLVDPSPSNTLCPARLVHPVETLSHYICSVQSQELGTGNSYAGIER